MISDRVVQFRQPAKAVGKPVSGTMTFASSQLFLPNMKVHFDPRWSVRDGQVELTDDSVAPVSIAICAETLNDSGELGYLDTQDDGFAGEFAVGPEHERLIRHAAFSPVPMTLTIRFAANADGGVTELRLGLERT